MILFAKLQLTSLYSLAPISFSPIISIIITLFTIVVITNSFNLIDGIDGLAGGVGLLICTAYGSWFLLTGNDAIGYICFAFVGALIAFLIYNWHPSRIFMGDTGALLLGFLISCLSIYWININHALEPTNPYKFEASISTAIGVLIIPILDTIRVFFIRLLQSKSPFSADNNHIHHILLSFGLSHSRASLLLILVNLVFVIVAILCQSLSDYIVLILMLFMALIFLSSIEYYKKKLKTNTQKASVE